MVSPYIRSASHYHTISLLHVLPILYGNLNEVLCLHVLFLFVKPIRLSSANFYPRRSSHGEPGGSYCVMSNASNRFTATSWLIQASQYHFPALNYVHNSGVALESSRTKSCENLNKRDLPQWTLSGGSSSPWHHLHVSSSVIVVPSGTFVIGTNNSLRRDARYIREVVWDGF